MKERISSATVKIEVERKYSDEKTEKEKCFCKDENKKEELYETDISITQKIVLYLPRVLMESRGC